MSVLEKVKSTLGVYSDDDVRGLLRIDHERLRELSKELAETTSTPRRRTLVTELQPLLIAHSRAEEASTYSRLLALRNSPDSRKAANEGMVEHNVAEILMDRLAKAADTASELYRAHAEVLRESLEHHLKEEERLLFEELGEHFSDYDRKAMALQFVAERTRLLEGGADTARTRAAAAAT